MFGTDVLHGTPHEFKGPFELKEPKKKNDHTSSTEPFDPKVAEGMKGLSLSLALIECCFVIYEVMRVGKQLSVYFRRESQEKLNKIVAEKIAEYNQIVKTIVLPILKAPFLLAGLAGPQADMIGKVVALGIDSADNILGDSHQAQLAYFEHAQQTLREISDQYLQGKRTQDETIEAIKRVLDQSMQQLQESFRSIVGG